MKLHYTKPLTEEKNTFSGAPFCGSTGERFNKGEDFSGLDDWSKNA